MSADIIDSVTDWYILSSLKVRREKLNSTRFEIRALKKRKTQEKYCKIFFLSDLATLLTGPQNIISNMGWKREIRKVMPSYRLPNWWSSKLTKPEFNLETISGDKNTVSYASAVANYFHAAFGTQTNTRLKLWPFPSFTPTSTTIKLPSGSRKIICILKCRYFQNYTATQIFDLGWLKFIHLVAVEVRYNSVFPRNLVLTYNKLRFYQQPKMVELMSFLPSFQGDAESHTFMQVLLCNAILVGIMEVEEGKGYLRCTCGRVGNLISCLVPVVGVSQSTTFAFFIYDISKNLLLKSLGISWIVSIMQVRVKYFFLSGLHGAKHRGDKLRQEIKSTT